MLGYPSAGEVFKHAKFGRAPSGDDFVLDDLNCTGSESTIFDCSNAGGEWIEDCHVGEIAAVRCANKTQEIGKFY